MSYSCPSCGKPVKDGFAFCASCGTYLQAPVANAFPQVQSNAPASSPMVNPPVEQQTSAPVVSPQPTPQTSSAPGAPALFQMPSQYDIPAGAWLVDPNEQIKFSLKNGYAVNAISSEGFISEDAILTNKRLYYNVTSMGLVRYRTEMKIDLQDITATTITDSNPYIFLLLGAINILVSILVLRAESIMGLFFFFLTPIFFVLWLFEKKTYFKIEYAGGGSVNSLQSSGVLRFSVKKYRMDAVRTFQKEIHKAKSELHAPQNLK